MAMENLPPLIQNAAQIWRPGTGQDPARRLLPDHMLRHRERPSLQAGGLTFIWPVGPEGFRTTGSAQLGIHHYIGDNAVEVQVVHLDENRIEMSGTFPGLTAVQNMIELRQVLMGKTPKPEGKILMMPGVFNQVQYVVVENYEFTHAEDDRTHSIQYSISFIRTGVGRRVQDPKGTAPPTQPLKGAKGRGASARYVTTKDGVRTLRAIAKVAYKNSNYWGRVYGHNKNTVIKAYQKKHKTTIPMHRMPTFRWPIGTKFRV